MSSKKGRLMLWLLVFFTVLGIIFISKFSQNIAFFKGTKSVESGTFFGLSIGDDASEVPAQFKKLGFRDATDNIRYEDRIECKGNKSLRADDTYIFLDTSWRNGVVCVSVLDDSIIEIHSDYSGVFF